MATRAVSRLLGGEERAFGVADAGFSLFKGALGGLGFAPGASLRRPSLLEPLLCRLDRGAALPGALLLTGFFLCGLTSGLPLGFAPRPAIRW